MLTHLTHPCFVSPFVFDFPQNSKLLRDATRYFECGSLQDVLRRQPSWWTPAAKWIAITGIVMGMRFLHRFGLTHGALKPSNILFDADHRPHIVDFGSNRHRFLAKGTTDRNQINEEFDQFPCAVDIISFASILFAILIDRRIDPLAPSFEDILVLEAHGLARPVIPSYIPRFARDWIESGWSTDSSKQSGFGDLYYQLRIRDFAIADGVDRNEVSSFVDSLEMFEQSFSSIIHSRSFPSVAQT
jgi:serine/threonine protein kinase